MASNATPSPQKIYAVLDANVLLPPRLSDVLFDMALEGLYEPRWTADIECEFKKNFAEVVLDGKVADRAAATAHAERRLACFRGALPEHEIMGYHQHHILQQIPPEVEQGDRHVAAGALQLQDVLSTEDPGAATYLVSNNLPDLAVKQMAALGISVVKPGAFIDIFMTHPRLEAALARVVQSLKKPPYTKEDLLGALQLHGAKNVVGAFSKQWGVVPAQR